MLFPLGGGVGTVAPLMLHRLAGESNPGEPSQSYRIEPGTITPSTTRADAYQRCGAG